jgi:DNA-binding transcriptional LysR family regulator
VDLVSLRYFETVARLEHISRAAEELRVAQPSLSRVIARLEAEIGVPLFDRHGRRIQLNRFGAVFLRRVSRALTELDDARRELADAAGLERGMVSVACETSLPLTGLLRDFIADHPQADLRLFQLPLEPMRDKLLSGEVDLCIASQPLTGPGLRAHPLIEDEEVMLAVPAAHRLAPRERTTVAELADEPIVTTRRGYWQRSLVDKLFSAAGLEPNIVCEGDEPAATFGLIEAGLGVGLLPAVARASWPAPAVAWLHLADPQCSRTLSVVWHENTYLSAAARRFRDYATEHFRLPA